jgi:hypothetical protein
MSKVAWLLVSVAILAFGNVASAQPHPDPAPVPSSSVQSPDVTPSAPPLDLSQIFGASATNGTSLNPEPIWASCTVTQCKQPCRQECIDSFCTPVCVNQSTCLCGCFCQ